MGTNLFKKIINQLKAALYSSAPIQQDIVGLDLSHSYVRAIQLVKNDKQWSLAKIATKSVNRISHDAAIKDEEIVRLLKNIKLEQKFDTDNVAVSLPVNSAIIQVIQIPYLDDGELNVAVENGSLWESSINIPGELSEYSIFWQVVKRDVEKNQLSILFVASRIEEIEHYCDLVRKAGFEPLIVDIRCFALRNILKTHLASDVPTLSTFLEISGEENYIVFVYDNLPFIYDIFIMDIDIDALNNGGDQLTSALFNRIGSQVRASVNAFIKQSGAPGIEQIEFISSLSNFEKIYSGLKEEIVEFKLLELKPLEHVHIPSHLSARVGSEKNISSLTVATGLATRRLDVFGYFKFVTAVSNINLLPNRQALIEKEKNKVETSDKLLKLAMLTTVLTFVLMLANYYLLSAFPSNAEIEVLQAKSDKIDAEVTAAKSIFNAHKNWVENVNKINTKLINVTFLEAIPSGMYIVDITQKRKDVSEISLKSMDPAQVSMVINSMSMIFKNVKLLAVESNQEDVFQLSKITYQVE